MKSDKPIKELITDFLNDQDVKEKSRYQYKINLNQWLLFCITSKIDVREPRRADVISYKSKLMNNKSVSTIDGYLTTVRMFFGWMERNGIYENIAAGIHSPRQSKQHRKGYLKPDQVKAMLKAMPKHTISNLRDYAIVNLMVRTGCRRCEVERMNVSDIIKTNDRWQMYIQRKGHIEKDQVLGLSDRAVDPIHEYLSLRKSANDNEPMFINHSYCKSLQRINPDYISTMIKNTLRLINVDQKNMTGHSLRHTAAITALRSGSTIHEIQKMLGHRNSETTEIYLKAIDAETMGDNPAICGIDQSY